MTVILTNRKYNEHLIYSLTPEHTSRPSGSPAFSFRVRRVFAAFSSHPPHPAATPRVRRVSQGHALAPNLTWRSLLWQIRSKPE